MYQNFQIRSKSIKALKIVKSKVILSDDLSDFKEIKTNQNNYPLDLENNVQNRTNLTLQDELLLKLDFDLHQLDFQNHYYKMNCPNLKLLIQNENFVNNSETEHKNKLEEEKYYTTYS